ncbi:YdbC family protein [Weissella kandleri]|uniref:YdbC family protein n=1 Tax=Weissella kandleri TaxID=1616 RepID=UPI00387E8679
MAERGKIKFEIIEKYGVLSTSKSGWNLELNLVQWGENQPKFDIRAWDPTHTKMGKGVGLNHDEMKKLNKIMTGILAFEQEENLRNQEDEASDDAEPDRPRVTRLSD